MRRLAFRLDADAAVDANPPTLALLRLDAQGTTTDAFAPGSGNRITFIAHDVDADVASRSVASAAPCMPPSSSLTLKKYGAWRPQNWRPIG